MIKKIIKAIVIFLMPKRKIIIFEALPDFSDNTYWLFKYIAENNLFSEYKFVWFVSDKAKIRDEFCGVPIKCIWYNESGRISKIKKLIYLYTARVIVDCNYFIHKVHNKQIRVHLGHGMPIKVAAEYFSNVRECDLLTLSGEGFRSFYEKYINKDGIGVTGLPRNEILIDSVADDKKFIFWMPTYRQHKSADMSMENMFPLGIPAIKTEKELKKLDTVLGENKVKLLLRPHPAQDLSFFNVSEMKNILIANDEYLKSINTNLYELLSKSAALITDYSSVYYDYLLAERPIALTLEDHISYAERFGLIYENVREKLPGFLVDSAEDMCDFVKSVANGEDSYLTAREAYRKEMGIEPLPASKLITDFIKTKIYKKI